MTGGDDSVILGVVLVDFNHLVSFEFLLGGGRQNRQGGVGDRGFRLKRAWVVRVTVEKLVPVRLEEMNDEMR